VLTLCLVLGLIGYLLIGAGFARFCNRAVMSVDPGFEENLGITICLIVGWPLWILYCLILLVVRFARGERFGNPKKGKI
jgi:uncharacterized membrane protein